MFPYISIFTLQIKKKKFDLYISWDENILDNHWHHMHNVNYIYSNTGLENAYMSIRYKTLKFLSKF